MKEWVLGFVILPQHVVLLKKSKTMHVGLWNGLGGKIEDGETAIEAMRREGKEESGVEFNWKHAGYLKGGYEEESWRVFLYAASGVATRATEFGEITADFSDQALADTPFRIQYDELSELNLAPHTKNLVYICQDKVRRPGTGPIQLTELL